MLRITSNGAGDRIVLKLEGCLAGPWVAELESLFETLLVAASDLRPIAVFDEMKRRHPELPEGVRRTIERRIRRCRDRHAAGVIERAMASRPGSCLSQTSRAML